MNILRGNVYGWFERLDRGIYGLTHAGMEALARWPFSPSDEATTEAVKKAG
jgi:hypothetical protein